MVCVGDKVKVIREGGIYITYQNFMTRYLTAFSSEHTRKIGINYQEGMNPTEYELAHNFTVEYTAVHDEYDRVLAIVSSDTTGRVFIYNTDALSVVTPVSSIHVGDKVIIVDPDHLYSGWRLLIESQKGVIPSSAVGRWIEGDKPEKGIQGTVLWAGRHICRPDEDIVYIVEAESGVFILGINALKNTDCNWAKYIAYVRNWCTKHKDFAPSSNAGPLSLPDWEKEYKAHTLVI